MAAKNPIYDLVLLLSSTAEPDVKAKILSDTENTLRRQGEIVSMHDWGLRPTAFPVGKKTDAEYHLMQFHGDTALIEALSHTLRITDGVMRFRIIKLAPGVGTPPDLHATPANTAVGGEEPPPSEGDIPDFEAQPA